jgi:DNA-binding MarR family transcriptional regulator
MARLKLEAFLPYRLVRAAEMVSLDFSAIYRERYGLTRPEWRVLAGLAQFGQATATELGAHSSMHKTKVSRAVFALEQRKWLIRRKDGADRRFERLELTAAGRREFASLASAALDYEDLLLEALGRGRAGELLRALEKLERLKLPNARR